jgi:hypothetical protein
MPYDFGSTLAVALTFNSADGVYVLDTNGRALFTDANILKAQVLRGAKTMEQPLESGATVVDHRIILPIEITLDMMVPTTSYKAVYQQIGQIFILATLLSVQTRADVYDQLIITEMPHEESPDRIDKLLLSLRLKQVLFATSQYIALPANTVANPADSSTTDRGTQNGKQQPPGSYLNSWFGSYIP